MCVPDHRERGSPLSQRGLPGDESHPDGLCRRVIAARRGADASQKPWRLPQRRLLGRVIDIIRLVPCGQGACGVTFPGSRCKSFVWPVLCWACVPALPRLTSQALHKRPHPPWSIESRWRAMRACNDSSEGQPQVTTAMPVSWT